MCYYHKKYGDRTYKCGGAPCPFAASSCGRSPSENTKPHVHNLSSPLACADSSLFFVADKYSKVSFLVDTGASKFLFPLNHVNDRNLQPSTLTSLKALGIGVIDVLVVYKTQINLGFCRLFVRKFCISDMPYGILGADFLACQ